MKINFKSIVRKIAADFDFHVKITNTHSIFWSETFTRLHITSDCLGNSDNLKIFVATLIGIGAGGTDFNKILFPKLLNSQENINRINNIYQGCTFQRRVRLNTFKTNLYFHIADFYSIEDYLKIFHHIKITRPHVPKATCIADLKRLNATGDTQKLQRYNFKYYHWLECLRIVEFVNCANEFEAAFKRHYEGAQFLFNTEHRKIWRRD